MRVTRTAADNDIHVVPSPFPFNPLLQSASMNINNSKVTVQTQDILSTVLKQFDKKIYQNTAKVVQTISINT